MNKLWLVGRMDEKSKRTDNGMAGIRNTGRGGKEKNGVLIIT